MLKNFKFVCEGFDFSVTYPHVSRGQSLCFIAVFVFVFSTLAALIHREGSEGSIGRGTLTQQGLKGQANKTGTLTQQ